MIDDVVHSARGFLGAAGAAVTLIDHDRQRMMSVDLMDAADISRNDAFCDTTIELSGMFVVEDTQNDPRYADTPLVVGGEAVRFYAGYPIEAPSGHRIGALCVVDTKPRQIGATEAALLRDLALKAQDILWATAKATEASRTPKV